MVLSDVRQFVSIFDVPLIVSIPSQKITFPGLQYKYGLKSDDGTFVTLPT